MVASWKDPPRSTCPRELATGVPLEAITIISPTVHSVPSIVQGLWKSQHHGCKRLNLPRDSVSSQLLLGDSAKPRFMTTFLNRGGGLWISVWTIGNCRFCRSKPVKYQQFHMVHLSKELLGLFRGQLGSQKLCLGVGIVGSYLLKPYYDSLMWHSGK